MDLDPLFRTAVQADGRLRSFESHAKTYMGFVSGPRDINGQINGFTYLDLMLRPEAYVDVDLVYVKQKRSERISWRALEGNPQIDAARGARMEKSGLLARRFLSEPAVAHLLQRLGQDLIRTSKAVDAINSAVNVSDPRFLLDSLRVIAPPSGETTTPWLAMSALGGDGEMPTDSGPRGRQRPKTHPRPGRGSANLAVGGVVIASQGLARTGRPGGQCRRVAARRPAPACRPRCIRPPGLAMESWYFRYQSMTWVWLLYLASVVPLLMAVVYRWDRARTIGMVLFVLSFVVHSVSVGIRWYISGRWPNANMFEAVTTAAWFGGLERDGSGVPRPEEPGAKPVRAGLGRHVHDRG